MTDLVPVFDGHNDTLLKLEIAGRTGAPRDFAAVGETLDIDLPRARAGGFAGGLFAMFTPQRIERVEDFDMDDPSNFAPVAQDWALAITVSMFARMHRLARQLPDDLAICTDVPAIRAAMGMGRIAIVPHMEAQPVIDPGQGLSDAGRALVGECERIGVMVDLSHLTEAGFWDVAKIAIRPLVATHSNAHAVSPSARNLTDRQLAAVAESGGTVGLNFHVGFLREDCRVDTDTPLVTMIRHLDHMIGILGEGGVALGSDYDGCTLPGEIGDVTGLPRLVAAMRQAGYGEALITRICRDNWLDALEHAGIGG